MRGYNGWAERSASQYLPYVGHVSPGIVLLEDGSLLAMAHLHGLPHELAAASERNAAARFLSALWRQVADDVLTINLHLVRHQRVKATPPPIFDNSFFFAELARVYGERVLNGQLFDNSWYLSTVIAPRNSPGGATAGQQFSRTMAKLRKRLPAPAPDLIHETEEIWTILLRALDSYQIRRLGLRQARGIVFSDIAEMLRIILICEPLPVPLMSGPMASAIYTDRVISGRRAFEIRAPDSQRYGAIFGFREYPPRPSRTCSTQCSACQC
jgi:type IV secretion system protein VirB4